MTMNARGRRSGMAVFIVVMVSAVIGVFVAIVAFHGRDTRRKGSEKREKAQAESLAKGAHQHFLLKFSLMPTELYDAVSYSVGKNPYFDFLRKMGALSGNEFQAQSGVMDMGPMFFTGDKPGNITKGSDDQLVVKRSDKDENVYQNGKAGFGEDAENRHKMEYLLNHYILDIATDYPSSAQDQSIVVVSSRPHKEIAQIGITDTINSSSVSNNAPLDGWQDPFNGHYFVRSVKILSSRGAAQAVNKVYQTDSILVSIEATVRRDKQLSLVTRGGGRLKPLVVQKEVKTSVQSEQGWVTTKEEMESEEDFRHRVESTDDRKSDSGRRTEISTAIYFVSCKRK
ncbi:MAG: hypothetical protein HY815_17910 [Candidatus Riflebacteria bacterium]|nr:hypothetical protein [Candidatus Riflebacteria bacterium]